MSLKVKIPKTFFTAIMVLAAFTFSMAQNGRIIGIISDKLTHEPLPGANAMLEGTGLGAASNIDGEYLILNVPPGMYTLHVVYIGYEDFRKEIEVAAGADLVADAELNYVTLEGEEIEVTAQAEGQIAAINQQLSAQSIKNIVSSSQIQEIPDANAAESLRRLPGVTITRVGGEGNQVVIRGLQPKFNAITIDGVRMASSGKDDRAADLSMISSTMLEGIEVSKTVTADQDGDVLGGSVNFKIREARGGEKEGLGLGFLAQNGYTGLATENNEFSNYKFVPSLEGRFLEDRLGVFLQATIEKRNLTSNEFSADYAQKDNDPLDYITHAVNLHNIPRDKERLNGALVMDYRLPNGKISLSNFLSSGTEEKEDRNEQLIIRQDAAFNQHLYNMEYSKSTLSLVHNSLSFEHQLPFLPIMTANLNISHSYSETKNPDDWTATFYQVPAGLNSFEQVANLSPKAVNDAVLSDPASTRLTTLQTNDNIGRERAITSALDFSFPLLLSNSVSSKIKFGGKYKTQERSYRSEVYGTNATLTSPSARAGSQIIADYLGWTGDATNIPLTLFLDDSYDYGDYLNKEYMMRNPMNFSTVKGMIDFVKDNSDAISSAAPEAFARNNYLSNTHNYSGDEVTSAGYLMATVKIGDELTIIPGIRYQNLETTYSGVRGQTTTFSFNFYNHDNDTTITRNHPFWLPSINIQYRPLPWFDVRLAYSNTISYPDFNAIIPRIDAGNGTIAWNNFNLKPLESDNYDIYFSFSENRIGLFTVGGFLKKINNLIRPWTFSVPGRDAGPYYLTNRIPSSRTTYLVSTFINNPFTVTVYGLELDWQTHFWYLPGPLNGLVLNINYTRAFSEAEYPYQKSLQGFAVKDTSYIGRLIDQPNDILNFTLGYDYKDFSIRFSYQYTDDVFSFVSQTPGLRGNTDAFARWDVALKQQLPWYGLQIFANLNNLNEARDKQILQKHPGIPSRIEEYGLTGEFGLRWQL